MLYQKLEGLKNILSEHKNIIITTHAQPDGDAIGSTLGLYQILKALNIPSKIILPTPLPQYLSYLPDLDEATVTFETQVDTAKELINSATLYFYLDINQSSRTGNAMHQFLQKQEGKTIVCIDHHLEFPSEKYDYYYSDSDKSSTCEMVFDVIESFGWQESINMKVMTAIYTGLVTDTGSFRFSSTSSRVHYIAQYFLDKGLKSHTIHESLFNNNSERKLRLLGHLLSEKMSIFIKKEYGFMYLDMKTAQDYDMQPGDTEGFVNEILSIRGIKVAIFATQRYDGIKLSMRTEGEIDANIFMREHFNGGGHKNAAGGFTTITWDEIEKIFANYLPNFIAGFKI